MSQPPFAAAAQMIREMHKEALTDPGTCVRCRQPWPCPPIRDLDRCKCGRHQLSGQYGFLTVRGQGDWMHTVDKCEPLPDYYAEGEAATVPDRFLRAEESGS